MKGSTELVASNKPRLVKGEEVSVPEYARPNYLTHNGTQVWLISPANLLKTLALLRDHHAFYFRQLVDLTATDHQPTRSAQEPRFQLVYHLLSHHHNRRGRVLVDIEDGQEAPSVIDLYINANWYEREVWDLFGIPFAQHPDLRRILTDYDFEGHPLRKDFPLSGHTQVRFDAEQERVVKEPVELQQPYRPFEHDKPYMGAKGLGQ